MVSKRYVTEKISMLIDSISKMTDMNRRYTSSSLAMHRKFTDEKIKRLEKRIQKLEGEEE